MSTRTAEATIKGYYYQFDTSILSLLKLSKDTDSIVIEGVEDIDIATATEQTAIQCKYLSKPKFINSAVREPIILMLDHFVDPKTPNNYNYVLYAHFENETPGTEPTIDLTKLKEILTFRDTDKKIDKHYEIEESISDAQLTTFLNQFKFCFGYEFNSQQKQILGLLKSKFSCNEFEADAYFYNNALRVVIDKAIQKDASKRVISKADFIKGIDFKKQLFNEWFIQLRTKKEYLKHSAKNLKSTKTLDPSRTKVIVLGKEILSADNSEMPLLTFIENLIGKYYKFNSALRNAKPLTLVIDSDSSGLKNLKKELINSEIAFNDGHEEIEFSSHFFNKEPIKNTNNAGTKISKSSYSVKITSIDTLLKHIASIDSPGALINFSRTDPKITFPSCQFFDIKYCDNLKEVYSILEP